jgi:uncharacterized protein
VTVGERSAPEVTEANEAFWTGGEVGELRIQRCGVCGWWAHPPRSMCRRCQSRDLGPEPVSGHGRVWSFTVSRLAWGRGLEAPYVVAEVELDDQPGLHLITSLVDVAIDDVEIGQAVQVRFERAGDAWVPVFAP